MVNRRIQLIKLHLGCGKIVKPGWKNLDIEPPQGAIVCDLRGPIPEQSNTVDYIFNEHFIEHLNREEGVRLLRECYRVLKPKGVLRISTPDLWMLAIWYQQGPINQWPGTWEPKTPAQFMNEAMRLWGHQFLYDMEELSNALNEAGFKELLSENHGESEHEALRGIEARPYHNDLILEAKK